MAQVWKVRTGQCLRRYEKPHTQGITSLAFSRDGSHILSASYDGLVRRVIQILCTFTLLPLHISETVSHNSVHTLTEK